MASNGSERGPITASDLYSLEDYHRLRPEFRERVLAHKKNRQIAVGPNATLYFEDRLTMQYQVQEMLRIERIFEAEGIDEELQAYNPLIPTGTNLKNPCTPGWATANALPVLPTRISTEPATPRRRPCISSGLSSMRGRLPPSKPALHFAFSLTIPATPIKPS
jgi:hypothetical protein